MVGRLSYAITSGRPSPSCCTSGERPLVSFELFPPKDDDQQRQLWHDRPGAGGAGPGLRLGDLRRERLHPRPHHRGDPGDRAAHDAADDGAPDLRQPVAATSSARSSARTPRPASGTSWPSAATCRADRRVPWERHPEGLANATELVAMVRELGDFCIGVAAFPDLHPRASRRRPGRPDPGRQARRRGRASRSPSCSSPPSRYFELVDRVRAAARDLPIIPGIMPVTTASARSQRFAELSGAALPRSVIDRLNAVADDPAAGPRGRHPARHRAVRGAARRRRAGAALLHP